MPVIVIVWLIFGFIKLFGVFVFWYDYANVNSFVSLLLSVLTAYVPLLSDILYFFGATKVWHWQWYYTVGVLVLIYVIMIVILRWDSIQEKIKAEREGKKRYIIEKQREELKQYELQQEIDRLDTKVNVNKSRYEWQQYGVKYAGAWKRFAARTFDVLWDSIFLLFFIAFLAAKNVTMVTQPYFPLLLFIFWGPACMIINGIWYCIFSNTPGKFIAGISLTDIDGNHVGTMAYFIHNLHVWWYGMFAGIPILGMFTCIYNAILISKNGRTNYDKDTSTEMRVVSFWGFLIFPAFFIMCFIFAYVEGNIVRIAYYMFAK